MEVTAATSPIDKSCKAEQVPACATGDANHFLEKGEEKTASGAAPSCLHLEIRHCRSFCTTRSGNLLHAPSDKCMRSSLVKYCVAEWLRAPPGALLQSSCDCGSKIAVLPAAESLISTLTCLMPHLAPSAR